MRVEDVLFQKVKYNYEVSGISTDSRSVKKNDIFICNKGYNYDSNDYIEEVLNKKVKTIITDNISVYNKYKEHKINLIYSIDTKKTLGEICKRFYAKYLDNITIIGITGTNGKTTVSTLVYKYYRYLGKNIALIGTNGIYINDEHIDSVNTTPDILTIYNVIKKASDIGCSIIVMEVSSQGIKEGRVIGLDFDVALFTNITLDHLDYHKTFDDYFYTKLLFMSKAKVKIINNDMDNFSETYRALDGKVITFGKKSSNYKFLNMEYDIEQTIFDLLVDNNIFHITTSLLGEYNVYNIASFIAIIDYLDSFNQYTLSFLNKKIIIDGRLEIISSPKGKFIIDFAHTPDGVENVLKYLNIISSGRIITVMGMGGNRDKSKRPIVGEIISKMSDVVILTSDNPRFENPLDIIEDIKKGIKTNIPVYIEPDRRKAIKLAYNLSSNVDVIALLGKGNESYLIIDDEKIPYSDREEVYKLINKRGN